MRGAGGRIVLNRRFQRSNGGIKDFKHVGIAIPTARQLLCIAGNALKDLLAGMADRHVSRRIDLLSDRLSTTIVGAGCGIKRCTLGFVSRKDIATIAIRRVSQVHQLVADPLDIGRQRKTVVIA